MVRRQNYDFDICTIIFWCNHGSNAPELSQFPVHELLQLGPLLQRPLGPPVGWKMFWLPP